MADYTIKVVATTEEAENKLKRVEKHTQQLEKNININVNTTAIDRAASALGNLAKVTASTAKTALDLSRTFNVGPGAVLNDIEYLFQKVRGSGEKTVSVFQAMAQATPTKILGTAFNAASDGALQLSRSVANVGYEIFGLTQSVNILKTAFGGLFDETVGREIRLQEALLRTKTTLISTSDVIQDGIRIKDPYKALQAIDGPINKTVENIRRRSLEIAGTTSEAIIQTFGVVAGQIGQFGGDLKDAEDLAISFAGALGTIGLSDPVFATQEIRSIMTGNIGPDSMLARMLGLTNEDVKKAKQSAGGLVAYLQEKLKAFGAGQKIASQSFGGILSNLKEIREEASRLFGAVLLAPLLESLTGVYLSLIKIFDTIKAIATSAGGAVANVINVFKAAASQAPVAQVIKIEPMAESAKAFTESFKGTVAAELIEIQPLITRIINEVLEGIARITQGLGALAQGFVYFKFEELKVAATQFANLAAILNNTVVPALQTMLNLYGEFLKLPLVNYLSQVGVAQAALEKIGVLSVVRLIATWKFYQESINTFIGWIKTLGSAIKNTFDFILNAVANIISGIGQSVADFLSNIVDILKTSGEIITRVAFKVLGSIGTGIVQLGVGIETVVKGVEVAAIAITKIVFSAIAQIGVGLVNLGLKISAIGPQFKPIGDAITIAGGSFIKFGQNVDGVITKLRGISPALRPISDNVVQVGGSFIKLSRNVDEAINQLRELSLVAQDSLRGVKQKTDEVAQNVRGIGPIIMGKLTEGVKTLGTTLFGALKGFLKFQFMILAAEKATAIFTDSVGRFQRANERAQENTAVEEALARMTKGYAEVGKEMTEAQKRQMEFDKQLLNTNYDANAKEIGELSKKIKVLREDMKDPGVNSIGEAFRLALPDVADFFGLIGNDITYAIKDLINLIKQIPKLFESIADVLRDSIFGELFTDMWGLMDDIRNFFKWLDSRNGKKPTWVDKLPANDWRRGIFNRARNKTVTRLEEDRDTRRSQNEQIDDLTREERQRDAAQIAAKERTAGLKELKDLERQLNNEIFQTNLQIQAKEIEHVLKAGQLKIEKAQEANRISLKGAEDEVAQFMKGVEDYFAEREKRELSLEADRKKFQLELADLEFKIGEYRIALEEKLAAIRQRSMVPPELAGESTGPGRIIPGQTMRGGAEVTNRNDPDGEQTGSDIVVPGGVGGDIQNPFEYFKVTKIDKQGSGQGESGRGFGNYITGEVKINGKTFEVLLGHIDRAVAKVGDVLRAGAVIAKQGISGHAKGAHASTHVNALDGGNAAAVLRAIENAMVQGKVIPSAPYTVTSSSSTGTTPGVGTSATGNPNTNWSGYLRRLADLETDLRPRNNEDGSGAKGWFQAKDPFNKEAMRASGGLNAQSRDYNIASASVMAWIKKFQPEAAKAIEQGMFNVADVILSKNYWPSLPGGSQARDANKQRQAARFLPGGDRAYTVNAPGAPDIPSGAPDVDRAFLAAKESVQRQLAKMTGIDIAQTAERNKFELEKMFNQVIEPLTLKRPIEQLKRDGQQLAYQLENLLARPLGIADPREQEITDSLVGQTRNEFAMASGKFQEISKDLAQVQSEIAKIEAANKGKAMNAETAKTFADLQFRLAGYKTILEEITKATDANRQSIIEEGKQRFNNLNILKQIEAEQSVRNARDSILPAFQQESLKTNIDLARLFSGGDTVSNRQIDAEAQIASKLLELEQKQVPLTEQTIENLRALASELRTNAENLAKMDLAAQEFAKGVARAREAASAIAQGYKGFLTSIITGGNPIKAMNQMLEGIAGRFLDMALEYAFEPVQQVFEQIFKNNSKLTDPKEVLQNENNAKLEALTTVNKNELVPALKALTTTIEGITPKFATEAAAPETSTPVQSTVIPSTEKPAPTPVTETNPLPVKVIALPPTATQAGPISPPTQGIPSTLTAPALPAFTGALDFSTFFPAINPTLFTSFETGLSDAAANLTTWTTGLVTTQTGLGDLGLSTTSLSQTLNSTNTAAQQAPSFLQKMGGAIQGVTGALAGVAAGVAGAQQMSKGGTYNTLMGLAGIFSGIGAVLAPFSPMGALGGLFRAKGGPVSANRPYIVGEQGPELFMPNSDGEIVPNNRMDAAFEDTRRSLGEARKRRQDTRERTAMDQMTQPQGPINVAYESRVINNVEYVTTEQMQKATAQAAERGRALAYQGMQNSVRVRRRLGL